ncbi:hypothetical protein [Streptomyces sp. ST2-7A]|uniref:hypothetical protein n=1 Tax=Streptomyces sp. ST2-7A TaxID=2907214 RepID=UPI001F199D5E|nr:hypothetical protein [Streptomyces sp. ST2-7A]MCE7082782.1 hypothetical protein [Streptomyces sp. ST2-7A]
MTRSRIPFTTYTALSRAGARRRPGASAAGAAPGGIPGGGAVGPHDPLPAIGGPKTPGGGPNGDAGAVGGPKPVDPDS